MILTFDYNIVKIVGKVSFEEFNVNICKKMQKPQHTSTLSLCCYMLSVFVKYKMIETNF